LIGEVEERRWKRVLRASVSVYLFPPGSLLFFPAVSFLEISDPPKGHKTLRILNWSTRQRDFSLVFQFPFPFSFSVALPPNISTSQTKPQLPFISQSSTGRELFCRLTSFHNYFPL
jgi:hypothetical protein